MRLLGALLAHTSIADDVGEIVRAEHFADATHGEIYRRIMTAQVGVERDAAGLTHALRSIARIERESQGTSRAFLNMLTVATLVAAAALKRTESRGGHARADHRSTDPAQARQTLITLDEALAIRAEAEETAP